MDTTPMITSCLLQCPSSLQSTNIVLPEGPLRICPDCRQLYSSCTRKQFEESSFAWNTSEGTMPTIKDAKRLRQRMKKMLKLTSQLLEKPLNKADMLDVGCSSGSVLMVSRELGVTSCEGVEPAPAAAATAASLGFKVYTGLLEEARYPDASFDIVTLFEVIEHLPDPLALAREIHRILKPGGIWLFTTGNGQSWSAKILKERWNVFSMQAHGGHISFFNPYSVGKLASLTRFTVRKTQAKRMIITERELASPLLYSLSKIISELLAPLVQVIDRGHQMYAFLQKQ